MVGTSKPTLEERFQARAHIFVSSDDDSKPIVSQRSEPQRNRYDHTEEQGIATVQFDRLDPGIVPN